MVSADQERSRRKADDRKMVTLRNGSLDVEDDLSFYWLYTQCGLLRIARTDIEAWTAEPKRTIQVTTFDPGDGVRLVPILKGLGLQSRRLPTGKSGS